MSQGDILNLEPLVQHTAFQLHQADVRDEAAVARAAEGCSAIIHLAAYKIPRYSDALDTLSINSVGSENVAKAARAQGAKLVAASTSDVYGKNPQVPFSETADLVIGSPEVKRWAYAVSKMFEEQMLFAYRDRYDLDVVLLRFFGGYGPNQNLTWWGGPQSVFIDNALDDKAIEIHGDGLQTRSFTYISDHVDGIMRAVSLPASKNQVFNLGNTHEISIRDLGALIWQLVRGRDEEPKVTLVPYSTFGKYEDVRRRVPDIDKARALLGFEPKVQLEDGLVRTIRWQVLRRRAIGRPTPDPACGMGA
jgi:UDP-glucose 4-epimerase